MTPKTHIRHGPRLAHQGQLRLGCSAILLDESGTHVLLTRRSDNGQWCLPGGRVDAGESVAEAAIREVLEETGLQVRVRHLSGVYSDPDQLIVYPDGNQVHMIVLAFVVELVSGEIRLSQETSAISYIPVNEALGMDLFHNHVEQLRDALAAREEAFIR
jgi:8-oxo-dGTP pyrophosphatase MutT (NUDIX family)